MSKALYVLEASLHGIMTVPKTYKDYSSNSSVQRVTIYCICKDSGIMIDVKLQLLMSNDNSFSSATVYAAVTWTVNKEDEKRLLAFEIRCYDVFWQ